MKKLITFALPIILLAILLTGCAPDLSANKYDVQNIGPATRVVPGVVVSERQVQVRKETTGTGAIAGGVTGAVAGAAIGHASSGAQIIGGVAGALAGGLIGNAAEKGLSRSTNIEYIVKTNKGKLLSVVQGPKPPIAVGTRVLVILGSPARIIVDNS